MAGASAASVARGVGGAADAAVELEGLVKRYDGRAVVDGLDLTVRHGEILALLGPNGAGKTTTVEIVEGLRRPDAGRVRVLGLDPRSDGHRLRHRIGLMLQRGELPNQLRVGEAVEQFAAFYPAPLPPGGVLDAVGLRALAGQAYRTLSGGERQRLSLALALVGRPELAILDEPTAAMDADARRACWDLLRSLRDRGGSVLLTTHLIDEAESLADRVAIIDHGRLVALGSPADLRATDPSSSGARTTDETTTSWTPSGTATLVTSAGADPAPYKASTPGERWEAAPGAAPRETARRRRPGIREVRLELRVPLPEDRLRRLERLPGIRRVRTERPGAYALATEQPAELLMELTTWLWAVGLEPLSIRLGQASLEEVFLRLTGEAALERLGGRPVENEGRRGRRRSRRDAE